jgi:hypothetical protein
MTAPTVSLGLVARWTTRSRSTSGHRCEECATVLDDITCPECGQLAGRPVGMLAIVVDTAAGRQLVVAQRSTAGHWTAIRRGPATPEAIRALTRSGATGPATRIDLAGGLW